jgi:indole-3-glycerol phosphate synthase
MRLREAVDQPLAVLLLIIGAKGRLRLSAVVAGADAVLLITWILWRQVAVVAQYLAQSDSAGVVGIWLTCPPTGYAGSRAV